jgi:hypothetical protein
MPAAQNRQRKCLPAKPEFMLRTLQRVRSEQSNVVMREKRIFMEFQCVESTAGGSFQARSGLVLYFKMSRRLQLPTNYAMNIIIGEQQYIGSLSRNNKMSLYFISTG